MQRETLETWNRERETRVLRMQTVGMSEESQDMVHDLLQDITGIDSESALFTDSYDAEELSAALQHSEACLSKRIRIRFVLF